MQITAYDDSGQWYGTGFIVDNKGSVVTALNVISPKGQILPHIAIGILLPIKAFSSPLVRAGTTVGSGASIMGIDKQNGIVILRSANNIFDDHTFVSHLAKENSAFGNPTAREAVTLDAEPLHVGEEVFVSGFSSDRDTIAITHGTIATAEQENTRNASVNYKVLLRANQGDVGGPVVASDGAVVGMLGPISRSVLGAGSDRKKTSGSETFVVISAKQIEALLDRVGGNPSLGNERGKKTIYKERLKP